MGNEATGGGGVGAVDMASVGVSLAVSQLVVVRSENEAISKYTAAEILRNKRPWVQISIVANVDPGAIVSFYVCLPTLQRRGPENTDDSASQLRVWLLQYLQVDQRERQTSTVFVFF